MALVLIGLVFTDKMFSNSDDISITLSNLSLLIEELQKYNSILKDYISIAINNDFIEKLKSFIEEIKAADTSSL